MVLAVGPNAINLIPPLPNEKVARTVKSTSNPRKPYVSLTTAF
jgi:hypothetical protein